MKFFAILLCIAIGSVFGELQRPGFEKEKLEVTEDVNEARSLISLDDSRNLYSSDESLRVSHVLDYSFDQIAANTKDADSVENETPRNPSPVIETSTVKPSSSKAIKKNLEIMYLGKPAKHFKELREITRRNSTESKSLKEISVDFLKRLLASTDALSRKETNPASNSGKFLRRKREATIEDPPNAMASLKVCAQLRKKLPVALRIKMLDTDETEEKLVQAYAASKQNIGLISNYNSAKELERDQLRRSLEAAGSGATELMKTYKTLRKGTPWNSIKKRGLFKKFFAKPSAALTEYEELKRDELTTDGFLLWFRQIANRAVAKENAIEEHVEEMRAERSKEARMKSEPKAKKDEPKTKKDEPKTKKDEPEKKKDEPKKKKDDKEDQFTTGRPKMEVGEVRDDQNTVESRDEYLKLSEVFKEQLKIQLKNTDEAEKVILLSYVQSDYAPDDLLDDYYAERKKEIEQLKADLAEAGEKSAELLAMYKSIRKGTVWNFLKSGSKQRKDFFKKSSAGRTEFEALKKKELDIDRYLDGKIPIEDKAPARDDKAVAEGIQRASAIEEDKAKQEEEGTEATEMASKNGDDPPNAESSLMVQKDIQSKLSEWLAGRITVTNSAEEALLDSYAESTTASANLLADYNDAKAKEREVLKLEMAGGGPQEAQMLANYKKLRKGSPWNSLKLQDKYKTFFETPSAALTEYEDVKRDELSIDLFLNGENAVTVGNGIVQGANGNMVTRYANRRARAKAGREEEEDEEIQREVRAKEIHKGQVVYAVDWENERVVARAVEDEKAEEMERKVRAKETETVEEVVYAIDRENEQTVATTDDETKETTVRYKSHDNDVRKLAGVKRTETTTATNVKGNSYLLKMAILFAAVIQVITAILILGPQRDKFIDWCRRKKRANYTQGETESLCSEKGYWNGPKSRKVSSRAHHSALL